MDTASKAASATLIAEGSSEPKPMVVTPAEPPAGVDSNASVVIAVPHPATTHTSITAETQTGVHPDTLARSSALGSIADPLHPSVPFNTLDTRTRVDSDGPGTSPTPRAAAAAGPGPGPHVTISTRNSEHWLFPPALPPATTFPPQVETLTRDSTYGSGNSYRNPRRLTPPPPQQLNLSGVTRVQSAANLGDLDFVPSPTVNRHEHVFRLGTIGARLMPTLNEALGARDSALWHATWATYAINIAIGMQVFLGALTTALAGSLHGNSIRVSIAVLGSLSTLVASYLARTRGSSEPESSLLREQALSNYIRQLNAYILDHGSEIGNEHDHKKVEQFRKGLEQLLSASNPNAKRNTPLFDPETLME
ncbi:hypothetical protein B0F90DRAFT_399958 [Multifurca ochricompacta]|uniref:SMODS and SLOG-associating 2TM effector domain-containing protein n=1 Tax=Multifurca ochricompacta TaxID=376703 RepID=A0AAD4M3J8_9AGAM|nr:hypothetical protein B0F90DRAFT_399958 [Multifurca ochricompacta]